MDKLSSALKLLKLKPSRKSGYNFGSTDPSFTLKGLGLKGMKVGGLESKFSKEAVLQLLDIWHDQEPPSVVLMISADIGVRIFDKKGVELVSYKIHEIAYCSVDAKREDIFVFIASRGGGIDARCHAFFCGDGARAQAVCLSMAHAFDLAFQNWKKHEKTETDNATRRWKSLNDLMKPRKYWDESSAEKYQTRKHSNQSSMPTFTYDSEAFPACKAVQQDFDEDIPLLLQREGVNWVATGKKEPLGSQLLSEDEILWENETLKE